MWFPEITKPHTSHIWNPHPCCRSNLSSQKCFSRKKSDIVLIWVFPKIVVPQNGWFIMENPIKMGWFREKTHHFWKHPYYQKLAFQEAILSNRPKVHHRRLRAVVIKVSSGHRCNLDENAWGKTAVKLYSSEDGQSWKRWTEHSKQLSTNIHSNEDAAHQVSLSL